MYEWKKEDLETEYTYYDGTIFKGHAAQLLEDIALLGEDIFYICEELKGFIDCKYNGNNEVFIDMVSHSCDYYSIAPFLKMFLLKKEDKDNDERN